VGSIPTINAAPWHRYDVNEVTLSNGKVLDSYIPGGAIVSRKYTQLAEVDPSTARGCNCWRAGARWRRMGVSSIR
jgi:hypothetical protein